MLIHFSQSVHVKAADYISASSIRPSATCLCWRLKKGAIHVNAGGTGRAFCQAVLDLDRLVDLRVCVLEVAAYLAQTPPAIGRETQVQPTLGQETEGSAGNAFEIPKSTEIAAPPDAIQGNRPWVKVPESLTNLQSLINNLHSKESDP
ncbi:hypothetical protein [Alicycliphilus denitrificans]|uniref:hypothetical protein n=1 Tax=Alicycliphilus denitrificans TaxID=179636 RepID=UPI00384D5475